MKPNDKKRIDTIERRAKRWNEPPRTEYGGIDGDDILWLIALVRELEERLAEIKVTHRIKELEKADRQREVLRIVQEENNQCLLNTLHTINTLFKERKGWDE